MAHLCVGLMAALLILPAVSAADTSVPSKLRAAILLRALQYEKGYASGSGAAVIVVLGGAKGASDASEMSDAMRKLSEATEGARKVRIEQMSGEVSAEAIRRNNPAAIYVAVGNEGAVSLAAAAGGAIVLCGEPSVVGKGCMLSVEASGASSRVVIDLVSAEKSGRQFDARLLRLSRVIR